VNFIAIFEERAEKAPSGVPIFGLNLLIKVLHLKFLLHLDALSATHPPNNLQERDSSLRMVNPHLKYAKMF
jgi:hypothetical protein